MLCAPCGAHNNRSALSTTWSEKELHGQLSYPRVASLLKRTEIAFRAELGEVAGGSRLVEVHPVKEIEKLGAELELDALCEREILGNRHIPTVEAWKTQAPLAQVAERAGRV